MKRDWLESTCFDCQPGDQRQRVSVEFTQQPYLKSDNSGDHSSLSADQVSIKPVGVKYLLDI